MYVDINASADRVKVFDGSELECQAVFFFFNKNVN